MSYAIAWVASPKYSAGRAAPVIAIVHHRMVGTLKGTDITFTTGTRQASTTFGVGYGCGRAGHTSGVHVHQYVNLDDSAWGNGNWDPSGQWDDRYPPTAINGRTISIEHHDNGGLPAGDPKKGVVPDSVIAASIWLDALLLDGDVEAWRKAGIRWRSDANAKRIADEMQRIVVGPHTIVDHHYISGRLKPYCWRPWAGDPVGFPQQRYLDALSFDLPDSGTEEPVRSFAVPEAPTRVMVPTGTKLYPSDDLTGTPIVIDPGREFWYVGIAPSGNRIVAYEPPGEDANGSSMAMFAAPAAIGPYRVPTDATPFSQADIDAAIAVDRGNAYVAWRP